MKSILFSSLTILLLTGMSCSSTRTGNRMISFDNDDRSQRYSGVKYTTSTITGIVKDNAGGRLVSDAIVYLYDDDRLIDPSMKVITGPRGKFSFTVKDGGVYIIIINHSRFKEEKLIVPVTGNDINLDEIKLTGFYD